MHLGNWKPEDFTREFSEVLKNPDEILALETLLNEKHGAVRKARQFYLTVGYRAPWVATEVVLQSLDQKFYYPVQTVAEYKKSGPSKKAIASLLLDFVDLYFSEFLEDEDILVPIDWTEFECEGLTLFMRGQVRNKKLENEANKLLGRSPESVAIQEEKLN